MWRRPIIGLQWSNWSNPILRHLQSSRIVGGKLRKRAAGIKVPVSLRKVIVTGKKSSSHFSRDTCTLESSPFRMPLAPSIFCFYNEPYLHQSILKGRDLSFRTAFCQFWTTAAAETAVAVPRDISSSGSIVSPSKTSGPSSGALRYPNFSPDTDKQFLCFCPKRTYRNLE